MILKGKHILVGVSGGIAAYKSAMLIRELIRRGAEVQVVMTPMAKQFITPLTLATLSKHPILVDFFDPENGAWNSHVSLGTWADAYVVAPATANTLAKMATGIADNLLLTTYLSARCPVFVAPAMDLDMMAHPATRLNLLTLQERGVVVVDAAEGELASGLSGKGRMAEPADIVLAMQDYFSRTEGLLCGSRIMITAGPTYEKIDPVRFIGNYSSGKMGYAIAEELASRGAEVELISGPTKFSVQSSLIKLTKVESARQMYEAALRIFPTCHAAVLSAAVADFAPAECADEKIKHHGEMTLHLVPNPDIAAELGRQKTASQTLVGFALETNDEMHNAQGKLQAKNLDFIVLNSLADKGAGFMVDTNKITIIGADGEATEYPLKTKVEVAADIADRLTDTMNNKQTRE